MPLFLDQEIDPLTATCQRQLVQTVNELGGGVEIILIRHGAGKVVMRNVRVRNRDGIYQPAVAAPATPAATYVFNSVQNAANAGAGVFVQDDYPEMGLGAEPSRNRFVICDRTQFDEQNAQGRFNYLTGLEQISINPYTGRIVSPD